jgi:hypothetical protein
VGHKGILIGGGGVFMAVQKIFFWALRRRGHKGILIGGVGYLWRCKKIFFWALRRRGHKGIIFFMTIIRVVLWMAAL